MESFKPLQPPIARAEIQKEGSKASYLGKHQRSTNGNVLGPGKLLSQPRMQRIFNIVVGHFPKALSCCQVIDRSDLNKMTASNLAIVFGPNLLWSRQEQASLSSITHINQFTEYILRNQHLLFSK
ncbi:hypothetical protein HPB49_003333 [Dermacentor silvarum]|uniref:Uncharacterized protein n=1 Tax=Dermacentor silvarum TaxID=543639 RepID=A0ACB8C1Y2_DERSI|nr:hypothetical protein HPB49_003333 [Dermacentor silvarum]